MQQLTCPFCGPRPEAEFRYGGDAGKQRPARECSDAVWAGYLYQRRNARGESSELWRHAGGCGRWIVLRRDTVTHAVLGAEGMNP